jgi:hypothetical protein
MRSLFVILLFCTVFRSACQGADPAPALSVHYIHPNSITLCQDEPVSAPKGYRVLEIVSDRPSLSKQTLVAAETLLTQADLKSIALIRSSGGSGCELVFPEAMRDRLKAIRLNNTTGNLAMVLGGDTLVAEVSTLNVSVNNLKIHVQWNDKTSTERITKLAATLKAK